MKIWLAGASGLVGSAFAAAAARRGHRVIGIVNGFTGEIIGLAEQRNLDLTDQAATNTAVLDAFPDAIVNAAAIAAPEACDADPVRSQAMNVELPANLARAAHHLSARFIHLSSEQVFDGARTEPYAITDPVSPLNLYGRQKVASEQAVQAAAAEFAVTIRAPLLMGNSLSGRRSTHERFFADWREGKTPRLFVDEFRQPCTAENLAEVMLELCERRDLRGLFHWAGDELVSRHELGRRVREHFKLTATEAPLGSITRATVGEAARKRQACLALALKPLIGKLKTRPQTLAEQLSELRVPGPCQAWYLRR